MYAMKQRLELHVMAESESYARQKISWDAAMQESLDYQGGGVWYSSGIYYVGIDDDSILSLKNFIEDRMSDYGIEDYYVELESYY